MFLGCCFSVLLRLPPSLPPLFLLCAAPPPLVPAMCRAPLRQRRSTPVHVPSPALPPPSPTPHWPLPAVPRRVTVCPSHPSPLLAVIAIRSALPPAPCRSTRPSPLSHRLPDPALARSCFPHVAPPPPVPPRALPACHLLLAHSHILF
jgi:hypothetical protein